MLSVEVNRILLYKLVVTSSTLQPHAGCRMGHRKMTLKVYDYEVSAAAMATYRESEQGSERGSKPAGLKSTQFLAKDSYNCIFSSDGLPMYRTSV